jgi:sugar/nucleoside kinase (ribokinase family)
VILANADEAAALDLAARTPAAGGVIVIKDGPRPARLIRDDATSIEIAAVEVGDVRDTTGAGDAFAAGFLTALLTGVDGVAACRAGHDCAAALLRARSAD